MGADVKLKTCLLVVMIAVLAIGWTVASSMTNDDITVRIDEATSYITVIDSGSESNPPELYPISGYFKLVFESDCASRITVRFKPLDVVIPTIEAGPFIFPEYPVTVEGISFSGSGDPCSYWCGPGTCYSFGFFGEYRGTFDGNILSVIGEEPVSHQIWYPYFAFTINATRIQSGKDGVINLPQTGQTKCYNESGTEIGCIGTGQDGEIQAGVEWPDPRFEVSGDCVTDILTGLMWSKNGNLAGGTSVWQESLDFVAAVNAGGGLCGYHDWRLPNVNELESLINAGEANSATWLNSWGFNDVQGAYYWSSTTSSYDAGVAWIVHMWDGYVITSSKYNDGHFLLPVRSGQLTNHDPQYSANVWKTGQTATYAPKDDGDLERGVAWSSDRFADNSDGTITDTLTGLMWSKSANLPNGPRTWQAALEYIDALNDGVGLGGYHGWRLPNRKELFSLIDHSRNNPMLQAGHPFENVPYTDMMSRYWSSTSYALGGSAWVVDTDGYVGLDNKSDWLYVWPVRSGHLPLSGYPDISIIPNPVPFGIVNAGGSSDQSITVTNDGASRLLIGTITDPKPPFAKIDDACSGRTLWPDWTCTLTYRFSPTVEGLCSSNSNIPSNDPNESIKTINLTGTGGIPDISVNTTTLEFKKVPKNTSEVRTLMVSNIGNGDLFISAISSPGDAFSVLSENCAGSIIAAGETCMVLIQFLPLSAGTFNSSFSIISNDPHEATFVIELKGTGVNFTVSPNAGTLETTMVLEGPGFGSTKGKVLVGGLAAKVTEWKPEQISLTLTKAPASPGMYPVVIQPKEPKGAEAITEAQGFTLKAPEITNLSADHGGVGAEITITGKFFGKKKGKVSLGGKSCKVTSWMMSQDGQSDEIKLQVPKDVTGTQLLHVSNKVGSSGTVSFTVD
jgi:hypothetical protein